MSRFEYSLASPVDDTSLRRLMAATPSAGTVAVSFHREPSFFDAAVVEGRFRQTVIARDRAEGNNIVALGSRSARQRHVNGVPRDIGFLSNLRILPQYRSQRVLARGYRFLLGLHEDRRVQLYLTTIADGNDAALSALTSGRAGLPQYHYAGDYHTAVIPIGTRVARSGTDPSLEIRSATPQDLPALLAFLDNEGPRRQFFPVYGREDFFNPTGTFRDLPASDILLAFRGGKIAGTLGCWNQFSFRQTVVQSYSAAVSWARPLVNGWAQLRGRVTLPKAGQPFRFVSAALPVVKQDDMAVLESLLRAACARLKDGPADYLLFGLHERDPLRGLIARYQSAVYTARVYHVCWDDGESLRLTIDGRPLYLELGCL